MKKNYLVLIMLVFTCGLKAQTLHSVFDIALSNPDSIMQCDGSGYQITYELKLIKDTTVFINSLYAWTPNFHYEEDEGVEIAVGATVSSGHSFGLLNQSFNSGEVLSLLTMDSVLTYGPFVEGEPYFSFVEIYDPETTLYDLLLYKIYWCNDGSTTSNSDISTTNAVWVSLYPNPASSHLNLSFDFDKNTSLTIAIYDITGRELLNENLGNVNKGRSIKPVDIQSLAAGSYMIKVWNNEFSINRKFTKSF